MLSFRRTCGAALLLFLAACGGGADTSGTADGEPPAAPAEKGVQVPVPSEAAAYDGIAEDELLRFTGTEPFWGGEAVGGTLTYSTPEDPDGTEIAVERFAGRGGLSFSGRLGEAAFEMTVTPLACSDGMSDRTYPFTVTLKIGEETRAGCGWTERQPFEGTENP